MGNYGGNDTWHDLVMLPADNTRPSAGNFNLVNESVLDNLRYLKNRGIQKTTAISYGQVTGTGLVAVVGIADTWQDFATGSGLTPHADLTVAVGDLIDVRFESAFEVEAQDYADVQLVAVQDFGGANTAAAIAGAIQRVVVNDADTGDTTNNQLVQGVTLGGWVTITAAGTLRVKLQGRNIANSPAKVGIPGGPSGLGHYYSLRLARFRPNTP